VAAIWRISLMADACVIAQPDAGSISAFMAYGPDQAFR
jgi:hypothetical protein